MIVDSITSAQSDSGRLIFFTFTIVRDETGILQIYTKFMLSQIWGLCHRTSTLCP